MKAIVVLTPDFKNEELEKTVVTEIAKILRIVTNQSTINIGVLSEDDIIQSLAKTSINELIPDPRIEETEEYLHTVVNILGKIPNNLTEEFGKKFVRMLYKEPKLRNRKVIEIIMRANDDKLIKQVLLKNNADKLTGMFKDLWPVINFALQYVKNFQ